MAESKKLIGVFEPGGITGKKPSEMSEEELEAWADAMWNAAKPTIDEEIKQMRSNG